MRETQRQNSRTSQKNDADPTFHEVCYRLADKERLGATRLTRESLEVLVIDLMSIALKPQVVESGLDSSFQPSQTHHPVALRGTGSCSKAGM